MTRYGYFLSSEEYPPEELVRQARLAEEAGFDGLWISGHFHPWLDKQGESGFVWSVIGAISQATSLPVSTAVTCPLVRVHPAIIAQAAATSALLTEGRFSLGVGTGEALNEHILGDQWPPAERRMEMLEEAVYVIEAACGPDPSEHARSARAFTDAGFDEVYIGQVGGAPDEFSSSTPSRCCRACGESDAA